MIKSCKMAETLEGDISINKKNISNLWGDNL